MKKIFRIVFCLMFTDVKFIFIKIFHFSKFKFNLINICSPASEIEMTGGSIEIGNKFRMRTNCHIRARKNAKVIIGDNVSLNYGAMIVSHEMIEIGDNCQIAPNVMIYDHDHDYKDKNGINSMKYVSKPIIIGKNVWIGANVVILKGSIIGDNCVIGAGCIVKGVFDSDSLIINNSAKKIIRST